MTIKINPVGASPFARLKNMNKIEKLIEELCPQGVDFRALGEVAI